MKLIVYLLLKNIFRCFKTIYFRSIRVYGKNNIPTDGGVVFSPNHQGAFLDPLLVGTILPREVTSLTRGDVFGGPFQWFLDALRMLPIYRIRNGYGNLKKNELIFNNCRNLLSKKQWIMMFSEADHHNEYYLQKLSKGSSRLAYEAQLESGEIPIYIMPVGINYGHHQKPRCDLHIVFGEPIKIDDYLIENISKPATINIIRNKLEIGMKKCLWLPNNDSDYSEKKNLIHRKNTMLDFHDLKNGIDKKILDFEKENKNQLLLRFFIVFFSVPNFPPLFILKKILGLFTDIVFYSSLKFTAGILLLMVWWVFLFLLTYNYNSLIVSLLLVITCYLCLRIRIKLLFYIK